MSESMKFPGTKLTRECNFDIWKADLKLFAKLHEVWGLIDGSSAFPVRTDYPDEILYQTAIRRWTRNDIKAMNILSHSIGSDIKSSLLPTWSALPDEQQTAAAQFTMIEKLLRPNSDTERAYIIEQIYQIRKEPNERIIDFVSRLNSLLHQLANSEEREWKIGDLLTYLKLRIPDEYKHTMELINELNKRGDIDMMSLTSRLVEKERELTLVNEASSNFQSMAIRKGKPFIKRQFNNNESRPSSDGKLNHGCPYCGRRNHILRDCRDRRDGKPALNPNWKPYRKPNFSANQISTQGNSNEFFNSFCITLTKDALANAVSSKVESLILDNGATNPMSADQPDIREMKTIMGQVVQPDGTTLAVKGIGKMLFVPEDLDGQPMKPVLVDNALWIPNLTKKLLGYKPFAAKDCEIRGKGYDWTVFKSNNEPLFHVELDKHSSLQRVRGKIVPNHISNEEMISRYQAYSIGAKDTSMNVQSELLLHFRFGHANSDTIWKTISGHHVDGMNSISMKKLNADIVCESCAKGKHTFKPSAGISSGSRSNGILDLMHMDLGVLPTETLEGHKYFLLLIDDYSRERFLTLLKRKSDTFNAFVGWKNRLENVTGRKIKSIQADQGGEFKNNKFNELFIQSGIQFMTSIADTAAQNGVAERGMRLVGEGVRTLLADSKLPQSFWGYAAAHVVYIWNRLISAKHGKTPHEMFMGKKPNTSLLRTFGSTAYLHIHDKFRKKLDAKSVKTIYIGQADSDGMKGYKLYNPESKRIIFGGARDVIFDEATYIRSRLPQLTDKEFSNEGDNEISMPTQEEIDSEVGRDVDAESSSDDETPRQGEQSYEPDGKRNEAPKPKPKNDEPNFVVEIPERIPGGWKSPTPKTPNLPQGSGASTKQPEATPTLRRSTRRTDSNWRQNYDPKSGITYDNPIQMSANSLRFMCTDRELEEQIFGKAFVVTENVPIEFEQAVSDEIDKLWEHGVFITDPKSKKGKAYAGGTEEVPNRNKQLLGIPPAEQRESKLTKTKSEPMNLIEPISETQLLDNGNEQVLETRLVLTEKDLPDGSKKYKARLVVRGFQQEFNGGIADEVYSPVAHSDSLRMIIALAVQNDWKLEQCDFETAFLQSDELPPEEQVLVRLDYLLVYPRLF